jgi:putative two-component system response regulator
VNLPGIDGISAYRLLRSQDGTRHIPVLFVTAQSNRVKQANLTGWYDCIEKPFDIDALIGRVASIVGAQPGSI